ncbi:unnamed protein product [Candidula unifasciata]|uniref:Uncharacterized protein n=1 Tax=Candidula unifasciata TaxID=100452 RepID=A0A8S4A3K6_9EUPU|nr:unnamed protein product [Candidula unifasciata]
MSNRPESCHNFNVSKHERDGRLPYSASHPTAYSHEAKANCNIEEGSSEEFADYSLISSRYKQKYPPQTTHGLSSSSIVPGKENRTPYSSRIEPIFDPSTNSVSFKSGNVQSRASAERGPNSPRVEEHVYSPTHYGCGSRKQNNHTERIPKDACYISGSESSPSAYSKHSIQVYKNNMAVSVQHQKAEKTAHSHQDVHKLNRHNQPVLNSFHTQHTLTGAPNNCHYQQPKIRPSGDSDQSHQYRSQTHHAQTEPEPPYPAPPRYNHQHHARRKTWSPPALKMSLLNSSPHESRVCCSNDSLDICEEMGLERKTQSLSEDLDISPPKLAPISGVLAQKPGSNVIRPIAFKPVQGNSIGSSCVVRRQQESCDYSNGFRSSNPQVPKQNANLSGVQAGLYLHDGPSNIGAFNSMTKLQYHATSGATPRPLSSQPVSGQYSHLHPPTSYSHSTNLNNIHNNLQHSSSMTSQHNVSNNTYINVLAASSISTNPSSVLACDVGGFASDRPVTSHESQSSHSANVPCVSSQVTESVLQTPSPSDSGVGELEAMLREKDAEINTLREVMDRNERAIFQVYEERRNTWLHNTQELQQDYEHKLKVQNQKAMMTEQALSQQVCKLQKDVETLQDENKRITNERDILKQQTGDNQNLISQLKTSLEAAGENKCASSKDTSNVQLTEGSTDQDAENNKDSQSVQEELALKNKELFILKSKLHSFQTDIEKKNKELAEKAKDASAKTEELKTLKDELARHKDPPVLVHASVQTHVPSEVATSENVKPSMLGEKERAIHSLQEELTEIRAYIALLKEQHEKEREQWLDEKNKVVRYQKQLQLNYVQMQRKNVVLETEIQQLTLDLENRDMKLIALTGEEDNMG